MAQTIPEIVLNTYGPNVDAVARLDRQGEPCGYCQTEGATVQAQFYGTTVPDLYHEAHDAVGESCFDCLHRAMAAAHLDPYVQIRIEVGPPAPRFTNTDHPQYAAGTGLANNLIDAGEGRNADYWLQCAEVAAQRAEARDDDGCYHLAKGLADALREYLEGRV